MQLTAGTRLPQSASGSEPAGSLVGLYDSEGRWQGFPADLLRGGSSEEEVDFPPRHLHYKLFKALERTGPPGGFAAGGELPAALPGLEVGRQCAHRGVALCCLHWPSRAARVQQRFGSALTPVYWRHDPMLAWQVHGVGPVGLPLCEAQALQLKAASAQPPASRQPDDRLEAGAWRVPPERFDLRNPAWARVIEQGEGATQLAHVC